MLQMSSIVTELISINFNFIVPMNKQYFTITRRNEFFKSGKFKMANEKFVSNRVVASSSSISVNYPSTRNIR